MVQAFFHNMLIIIGFMFISLRLNDLIYKKIKYDWLRITVFSILASIQSILTMIEPFKYKDMYFDIRSIPVFFVTYVYGWKAGLISCLLPSLYRFYIGGPTVWQGIITGLIAPVLVASVFYNSKKSRLSDSTFKVKRMLLVCLVHCMITLIFMYFTVLIPKILLYKLNLNMTIFSLLSIFFIVILVNDYNKKSFLMLEMIDKQNEVEGLVKELEDTNNILFTLINVMPVGVMFTNPYGNVTLTNSTSDDILGGRPNISGGITSESTSVSERVYSIHRLDGTSIPSEELPLIKSINNGKAIKDQEMIVRRRDGSEKTILTSSSPVYDDNDKKIGGVCVFNDITNRKNMEQRLIEGRKIGDAFLNGITECLILMDKNGIILSLNDTCIKRLELKVDNKSILSINDFPNEIREIMKEKIEEVINLKKSTSYESRYKDIYIYNTIYPIFDERGNVEKLSVFSQDITKIKKAEKIRSHYIDKLSNERKKLKQKNEKLTLLTKQHLQTLDVLYLKNEELKIANSAKSQFIANISHELKTPLNIIMTYLEYLLEEDEEKLSIEQKEMLEITYNNSDRLKVLINDLLDISLLESHKSKFDFTNISVHKFIKNIVDDRLLLLKDSDINIVINTQQKDIHITTDELRLRQVIDNILDNAVKFSDKGDVKIWFEEQKYNLDIYIKDSGIGIDKDKIKHIFKPFYQADSSSKKKFEGAGLGLTISERIIKAMRGEISVSNNEDRGCCFKITIPCDCSVSGVTNE